MPSPYRQPQRDVLMETQPAELAETRRCQLRAAIAALQAISVLPRGTAQQIAETALHAIEMGLW